jgi:hypothetical protein
MGNLVLAASGLYVGGAGGVLDVGDRRGEAK